VSAAPAERMTAQPGACQHYAGASDAHQGRQNLLDRHASDMGDHATSPTFESAPAAARAMRS
jgi:hypothetical protein